MPLRAPADVLFGEIGGQRCNLQHRHQVTKAHLLLAMQDALAHRLRTANENHALLDERVDRRTGAALELQFHQRLRRGNRGIARRQAHFDGGEAQDLVEEDLDVLLQFPAGNLVGFGHIGWHRPAELGRIGLVAALLRFRPVGFESLERKRIGTEGLQIGVAALLGRAPYDCFHTALRRNPDRRMGCLNRTRPQVHVVELIVLAAIAEGTRFGPRFQDEFMCLVEALM